MVSPFEVLRIDPGADEEEVDRAFRRRVMEAHPDQGGSAREFRSVVAAYEALKSGSWSDGLEIDPEVGDEGEQESRDEARVEYLNYEVLDDHGWDLDDDDLFEKASAAGLDDDDYGRILVKQNESLLEAAENRGFAWPYACRGGACANCAVAVADGELAMPINHILPPEMLDRGFRLSCNGTPATDGMRVVYNVKHLPGLDDLRLPPRPFEQAHVDD
ncbi:ferredoxin Fer [Halalkalicoccus sp. NIPERK01]|uniref:ferredoxin Fer n=1 Tax=Halalkalicoccus sp. NIPERK01 TaxID=3053469 RepID=UPI00256EC95E|nr:ferredoxin Fer [Halalkalicoccus sp. NIPERK01]MDL5361626.1 ferredoxin Fer [Halalkalicoccus sp. NIPERK01]